VKVIVIFLVAEPVMVNIPPPVGIGFVVAAGVNSYVKISLGAEPVNVNICCTGNVTTPDVDASAVAANKLIRTIVSTVTERTKQTIRLLYDGDFIFDTLIVFMLTILHPRLLIQTGLNKSDCV